MRKPSVGGVRRFLLMPFACKWNGWVRDVTAQMEMRGWLASWRHD